MKKILVTTDLSDESREAFSMAAKQARAFSAELTVLAIIEDPAQAAMIYALDFPVRPDAEIVVQLRDKISNDLSAISEKYFSELKVSQVVLEATGPVHSEIISYAKNNNFDLIIMSTHGRSGLSRILIGSITERVVREAPCAILTIPSKITTSED